MKIKLELKWNDLWVGIFHKQEIRMEIGDFISTYPIKWEMIWTNEQHIWICLIPCLPIHVWWEIHKKKAEKV